MDTFNTKTLQLLTDMLSGITVRVCKPGGTPGGTCQ
jgi:hypothetical protein